MIEYVVGFLVSHRKDKVLLIEKTHPEWQAGLMNAPGGKIENGETPQQAIYREFLEETGLSIPARSWRHTVCVTQAVPNTSLVAPDAEWRLWFFIAYSDDLGEALTMTDEVVWEVDLPLTDEDEAQLVPGLRWALEISLDDSTLIPLFVSSDYDMTVNDADPACTQTAGR